MKMKNLKALADMVILEFAEVVQDEKTESGLILVNNSKEKSFETIVSDIGPEVPEDCGFKVGDKVIVNNHDLMHIDIGKAAGEQKTENQRAVTKYSSIWIRYE